MTQLRLNVNSVKYQDLVGFKLFADLSTPDKLSEFPLFSEMNMSHSSTSEYMNRSDLADLLDVVNRSMENRLDPSILSAIRDDGVFVVTGQQPGLLTGPMYTFFKAVTVLLLCQKLNKTSPKRIIPAFWIASEDHDIDEVNRVTVSGDKFVFTPRGINREHGVPQVGDISLAECRDPMIKFLNDILPPNDFKQWILDTITSCKFDNFGSMFGILLKKLFHEWDLVLIDSIAIRPLAGELMAQMVINWKQLEESFAQGSQLLRSNGYEAQLDRLNLFRISEGLRRRIDMNPMTSSPDNRPDTLATLSEKIRQDPESFSPGAALRPIVQDALIPVLATIGGPSELLYLWQISPLYKTLNIKRSKLHPRISGTFVENHIRKAALKLGIYPHDLMQIPSIQKSYNPAQKMPAEVNRIKNIKGELSTQIDHLKSESNKKWISKIEQSVMFQLDKLVTKYSDERLNDMGRGRRNLDKIAGAVYPGRKYQERELNIFHFLSRYGPNLMKEAITTLDPLEKNHQLIEILPSNIKQGDKNGH